MTDNNKPSRIILPNDPMRGELTIKFDLRASKIDIDSKGSDLRGAALATLAAAQGLVAQAMEAAGMLLPIGGSHATTKTDAKG